MCNLKQLHILHDLGCLFLFMGYLTCGLIFQARTWQWLKTCNLFYKKDWSCTTSKSKSQPHTTHDTSLHGNSMVRFHVNFFGRVARRSELRRIEYLVGGLVHEFHFYIYILGIIIPTDFHIFQRGRSTTNQNIIGEIQHQSVKGFRSWSYLGWWTPPLTSMSLFRCWYDKGIIDPFGNLSLALPNHVLYVTTISPNQFTISLL